MLYPKKGGIMKRLLLFIGLIIFFSESSDLMAQKGISFHVSYNNYDTPALYARKDIREFHAFQKKVDDFSYAVEVQNFRKAQRIKRRILRSMRDEIQDTREKLRLVDHSYGYSEGLHQKYRNRRGNKYSKRDGERREVRQLRNQLRKQTKLLLKLERLHLDRSRRFHHQGQIHQRLMYDFEETLKKDLEFSFKDYRYRNRRY